MEGMNYLTAGDLALHSQEMRGGGYDGYYGCHRSGKGMAATGIGLAAGLGGAALFGVLLAAWGFNNASQARAKAAENLCAGNTKAIDILANNYLVEMASFFFCSRIFALASASAEALALNALLGGNARNGQTCPQPVALYQPAMPCRCNTCCND